MIQTKPKVEPDALYNQRQAAAALGVERHTIARYEANGYIKFRVRKAGNTKVTTGAQIIKCWESMYL
jgi:predicted site-specific integrase-resolvase